MKFQNTLGTFLPQTLSVGWGIIGKNTPVGRHLTLQLLLFSCCWLSAMQGRESQVIGLQILAAKASGFQGISVVFGDFSYILFLVVYTDDKDQ